MFMFEEGLYPKPNRITETKDKDYHAAFAKYCISIGFGDLHRAFVRKSSIIRRFYANDQWLVDEDLEAFLKDESGGETGRIKVAFNIIRPMVEQYRGNAININMNAAANSTSGKVKTRRDERLAEALFFSNLVGRFRVNDALDQQLRDSFGVGENEQDTTQIFENAYADELIEQQNKLLQYCADYNQFPRMQVEFAEDLALSGLCVAEGFPHNSEMNFEWFPSNLFFWDRSCYKRDLTDSQFQGRLDIVDPTLVFERFPDMDRENKEMIEQFTKDYHNNYFTYSNYYTGANDFIYNYKYGGFTKGAIRVPQYKVFWRDVERYKYGWVNDPDNYPILTRIDHIKEGEEKPRYTESDLIDPPDTPESRKLFGRDLKNKTVMHDVDVLRYCMIIPQEVFASAKRENNKAKTVDVVLDYGIYPYQEQDNLHAYNIKFPFKVGTWSYQEGEILSPLDSIINPQRLINRILSVQESHINNSGGTGTILDHSAIHGTNQSEGDIVRKMKNGQTVFVNSKNKGVPNTVGKYDATPGAGTYQLGSIISDIYEMTQRMSGINDPLQGQSTGPDQLVGVTELMIQRGSLMQEPFYYAITDCFLQMYQHIATVGKRIYLDNPRELVNIVGPDGHEVFTLSEDLRNEDFRVFVTRENTEDVFKKIADQELFLFKELGLITDKDFADLRGRSNPREVMRTLRQTAAANIRLDKINAEQLNQQVQAAQATELAAQDEQNAREDKHIAGDKVEKSADRVNKFQMNSDKISGDLIKQGTK